MKKTTILPGIQDMLSFGLVEALLGRRSRRFFMGAEIPDGVFAYKSRYDPVPLSDLEKFLVVAACSGNTSWHHMILRAQRYAPYLSNYAGAAAGRTWRRSSEDGTVGADSEVGRNAISAGSSLPAFS